MTVIAKDVNKYILRYGSGASAPQVIIELYNGFTKVGVLHFYADGKAQPANSSSGSGASAVIDLQYPMSSFAHLVGMLREESPLCILYNTVAKSGEVSTGTSGAQGAEPVGEQEGV